ncbi:protein odr-4 homolog isoform X1 [Megalops cyprinoides]|uniref:protein odr-4 homolog isoform X1 n=1 Tax=Megalops cyprinoides TaxID=118141 RepID=UPI0018642DD0|nr:protein odr-4 homolog isoform X1 [Megalops cyprinoides]
MGRSYIVDELVEKYLVNLKTIDASYITGLLIGQFSPQKDFVVLAARTPPKEKEAGGSSSDGGGMVSSLDDIDVQWVSEHAKQVSHMLPGSLAVLGVFLVHPPELSKEAQNSLRRLIFAVDKRLSKGRLWKLTEDDVPERVMLQICSKTRKAICRTFDVQDPKSSAKPADWKYQAGVSASWQVLQCSVDLDVLFPMAETSSSNLDKCTKDGLQRWANQIETSICLINGKRLPDHFDVTAGQKKNSKAAQSKLQAQILIPTKVGLKADQRSTASVQACKGFLTMKGVMHCRAYIHSNKPRACQAVEAIKRDLMNTVSCRTEMLFEDLFMNEGSSDRGAVSGQQPLPQRVFAPVPGTGFCICDYMFPDESLVDVSERFKEMLDCDILEETIDTTQEAALKQSNIVDNSEECTDNITSEMPTEAPENQRSLQTYVGVAVATGVALLATAASLLYLSD